MKKLLLLGIALMRGCLRHFRRCQLDLPTGASLSAATSHCTSLQLDGVLLGRQRWYRMVDLELFKSYRQSTGPGFSRGHLGKRRCCRRSGRLRLSSRRICISAFRGWAIGPR